MSVFSRLRAAIRPAAVLLTRPQTQKQAVRLSHERTMEIKPSTYAWKIFFNDLHFYLCLTGIPLVVLITSVNIFVGPATLSDIPEGYEPELHEYYKHPITRFFVKYLFPTPQSVYEKNLHGLAEIHDKYEIKELTRKVTKLSKERGDYQYWYYIPAQNELATRVSLREMEDAESQGHFDNP